MLRGGLVCAEGGAEETELGIRRLRNALQEADAVLIGAGAGMSTAAGLTYSGPRFDRYFSDFRDRFGITDIYSGGFYPFPDEETFWAWWARHIYYNRYDIEAGAPYKDLLQLVKDKDYFVITTNVDHQFQLAGFSKERLFYTQGDYGLFQCSVPCSQETYDNEEAVRAMMDAQEGMRIPSELIPRCPRCGEPMTTNLRADGRFVQDEGWYAANARYEDFCRRHEGQKMLYLELGVGGNTPVIIKYPFWEAVSANEEATYACVNMGEACAPKQIEDRSILLDADIARVLADVAKE
ncbi:MAG: Sir2 silent information regulator family NAD-dependent deacetylase [Eggerthellaceae bacterium]|nr:Sir2 silent information regulator family NAD-dependent deacetylase [Eggerthellaceae bacterium]